VPAGFLIRYGIVCIEKLPALLPVEGRQSQYLCDVLELSGLLLLLALPRGIEPPFWP
jgi:hypothetical protein